MKAHTKNIIDVPLNKTDALILCGGLGKRLRSAIGESQKVMAKVGGDPFLSLILTELKSQGIKRVVLLTGYKAEALESYYREHDLGLTIEFSKETEALGTGGAVKNAQGLVTSDQFLVLNGDSFCCLNLAELVGFHLKNSAIATVAVSKVENAKDFGSISLDQEGRITGFQEKEKVSAGYVNAGVYVFDKGIFQAMPSERVFSMEKDFFPKLIGKDYFGFVTTADFIDIGTPERLRSAENNLRKAGGKK